MHHQWSQRMLQRSMNSTCIGIRVQKVAHQKMHQQICWWRTRECTDVFSTTNNRHKTNHSMLESLNNPSNNLKATILQTNVSNQSFYPLISFQERMKNLQRIQQRRWLLTCSIPIKLGITHVRKQWQLKTTPAAIRCASMMEIQAHPLLASTINSSLPDRCMLVSSRFLKKNAIADQKIKTMCWLLKQINSVPSFQRVSLNRRTSFSKWMAHLRQSNSRMSSIILSFRSFPFTKWPQVITNLTRILLTHSFLMKILR